MTTESINEIESDIEQEFAMFDDWADRYEYLIDMGKDLPVIDDKYKVEENLIKGCQSRVWLHADYKDGKVVYTADSDALITKGLVALMIRVLSNHTPEEIVNSDVGFIERIGLKEHLSPTRSNGLVSMIKEMKMYALGMQAREKQ